MRSDHPLRAIRAIVVRHDAVMDYVGSRPTTLGEATLRAIPGGASFSYRLDYENHTGSKESITYQEKPDWVKAGANQATISGVPPATPRTDTLVAVISAAGKSDTLKLTIVTSATSIPDGGGKHK